MRSLESLDADQQRRVRAWWPGGVEVVADLSWGLVDTTVLRLRTAHGEVVLKAGGPDDGHVVREIDGYAQAAGVWSERDLAPRLLHADAGARLVVVSLLPGTLALGTPAATDPEVHRQAGASLALLHRSGRRVDPDAEARQRDQALALLDAEHRIEPDAVAWLQAWLEAYDAGPCVVVPTHGDVSPRNWLVEATPIGPVLRHIDLGRFAWRPACSDLVRLHERHWRGRPELAAAFVEGYGEDPRTGDLWVAQRVREAVGTATWALRVGDEAFEREGLRMVEHLVAGR